MTQHAVRSLIYSGITLYMLVLMIRWLGRYVEVDTDAPRLRWAARVSDPLFAFVRRILPSMGPADWAPPVAILAVWIVRVLLTNQ